MVFDTAFSGTRVGSYAYSPYIWPMLAPALFALPLSIYAWHRRKIPGALPLVGLMAALVAWAASAAMVQAAADVPTEIFWVRVKTAWQLPALTASFWFALEYTSLDRYLSRWALRLLAVPPLLAVLVIAASPPHLVDWQHQHLVLAPNALGGALLIYGITLATASSLAFVWLFVSSPRHRWPAAICLCGHLAVRVGYLLDTAEANPLAPLDATVLGGIVTAAMYAVALFRFGLFAVIPVARGTVIEQMREGMLVLDPGNHVLDLNPAAARILGEDSSQVIGRAVDAVLPASGDAASPPPPPASGQGPEITVGSPPDRRHYAVWFSGLVHRRGLRLGTLALLHDVTSQVQAQARIVEQERALAALRERDLLARELHDGIGQVLGFVKLQATAARVRLAAGQVEEADRCLQHLQAAAKDAHGDVRDFILASAGTEPAFLESLNGYVRRFGDQSGIAVTLDVAPGFENGALQPTVAAQLLRIIQESLTNVRKHAGARNVRVSLRMENGEAEAVIRDDGLGFDGSVAGSEARSFGLRFMQERAREVGGSVTVRSESGRGTNIFVKVPASGTPAGHFPSS